MIKALIFDVDGTLAETEEVHRRAFNETFRAKGLDWFWDEEMYAGLLKTTGGKERMIAYQRDVLETEQLSRSQIMDLHRDKTDRYNALLAEGGLHARSGVVDLVDRAKQADLKLAVATTTNLPNVEGLVKAIWGLSAIDVFDVIAAGDMAKLKKPAPDIYLLALDALGVFPGESVAFEDSRNGLLSARRAGLKAVVTPSHYTQDEDFTGAARVLPCLDGFDWCGFDF